MMERFSIDIDTYELQIESKVNQTCNYPTIDFLGYINYIVVITSSITLKLTKGRLPIL
jgi:hypothetical protein